MSFIKRGTSIDEIEEEAAKVAAEKAKIPSKFSLQVGETKDVILLDDEFAKLHMHIVPVGNGRWKTFVCNRDLFPDDPDCVLCMNGYNRDYYGYLTCIDIDGYMDKRTGKEVRNVRRLFPMKKKTMVKFARKKDARGTLVGCRVKCSRDDQFEPGVGGSFEFSEKCVDVFNDPMYFWEDRNGKLHKPEPYDYEKIFAPMDNASLRYQLRISENSSNFDYGNNRGNSQQRQQQSQQRTQGYNSSTPDDDIPY
jgi:hypothetical protein